MAAVTAEPAWFSMYKAEIYSKLDNLQLNLESEISKLRTDIVDVQKCAEDAHNIATEALRRADTTEQNISKLQTQNQDLQNKLLEMTSKITALESQSRRSNLKIYGIPEPQREDWAATESIVRNIFLTNFKFSTDEVQKIMIERTYRLGPFKKNATPVSPRPIIVRFTHYKDRQKVWDSRTNLKNTKIWLAEDYPAEIEEKRKILYPLLRAALAFREKKLHDIKQVALNLDKLVINNTSYAVEDLNKLPKFLQPESTAKRESESTLAFYSRNAILSNFYLKAPFALDGATFSSTEKYYQYQKACSFNDMETARSIMKEDDPLTCSRLGKEVKNYENSTWMAQAEETLLRANTAKFLQNEQARNELLASGDKVLAESTKNKTWGSGLALSDIDALNETKWPGKNLMGKILMKIRSDLKK